MSTPKNSRKKRKSKKRQINTRLLSIIGLSVVILGGVGLGLVYLRIQGSVSRNLAAGDAKVAEGKIEKALRHYGRSLRHEPGNKEAHQKRIAAYQLYVPESRERAQKLYPEYLAVLGQRAHLVPSNDQAAWDALDQWHEAAWNTKQNLFWEGLKRQAEVIGRDKPEGSDLANHSLFMTGIAKMRLGESNFLGDIDETGHVRFPGEAELTRYVELVPNSDVGLAHLAYGRMAVARRLGLQGNTRQEAKNLEMAQETYDRALEVNPEGIATLLAVIRHLYIHELIANVQGREEIKAALDQLMERLAQAESLVTAKLASVPRHQVLDLLQFLEMIDLENGGERSIALMKKWVELHPTDYDLIVRLARAFRDAGLLDESTEYATTVLDAADLPVSLNSYLQFNDRILAAIELFEVNADLRDQEDSDQLAQEARAARGRVVALLDGDENQTIIKIIDGRIAHQNGEHSKAVRAFEEAVALSDNLPAEVYRLDAESLENIGQPGQAVNRLRRAIETEPRRAGNRLLLASLHIRMRNFQEALGVLQQIPESVRINNPEIARMEEAIQVMPAAGVASSPDYDSLTDPILKAIARADKLDRDGLTAESVKLLGDLATTNPDDVRLLMALAMAQARLDRNDEAFKTLDQALVLAPDNKMILDAKLILENPDPVDRIKSMVASRQLTDEDRIATIYAGLTVLADSREAMAESEATDPELAETHLEIAARAREEAESMADQVEAMVDHNTQAFAIVFERYLRKGQYDLAEQLVEMARVNDIDQAGGNLAEARFLLNKALAAQKEGNAEEATALFEKSSVAARRATDVAPWRNQTWVTLGQAMRGANNLPEARIAMEAAVERDPSDLETIRLLSALHLAEGGDTSRAVALLGDASRRSPNNKSLRNAWLQVEAAHGSEAVALGNRMRDWKETPDDREAALWYAGLMAAFEPKYTLVLRANGQPSISGREWLAMNSQTQQETLAQLKANWIKTTETIADQLAQYDDETVVQAIQHATLLREIGRRDEMMGRLTGYLDAHRNADDAVDNVIRAGSFLSRADRAWEAQEIMLKYRDIQDPDLLQIDTRLAFGLHEAGQCDKAMQYLESVVASNESFAAQLRMADCLLQLGRLDEAEQLVARLDTQGNDAYQVANLKAGVAHMRGQQAQARGDSAEMAKASKAYRAALERASEIDQTRTAPYAALVTSLVQEYSRTLDRSLLEEALRFADAGMQVGEDDPTLIGSRADVLIAMGQPRQAVLDLEAYLRRHPGDRDMRSSLVDAYDAAGTPERSVALIKQAISREPRDPYWHGMLGDLLIKSDSDRKGATTSYITAWNIEPTRRRLRALTGATLTELDWDYNAAIRAINAHPAEFAGNARLMGLRARAEAGLGLRSRSRESLREARVSYEQLIENGGQPPAELIAWYEDLYALYPRGPLDEPLALVEQATGGTLTLWDTRGISRFYSLRGSPEDLELAIESQKEVSNQSTGDEQRRDLQILGGLYLRAKDNQAAAEAFRRVVELAPEDSMALNNYAFLLATVLEDPAKAEPIASKAVMLSPRNPSFVDTMATIQELLGQYEAAVTTRKTMLGLDPNNIDAMLQTAILLTDQLKRPQEAMPYVDKAVSLQPRDPRVLDVAGWAAWNSGLTAQGQDQVSQSIRQRPSANAHLHMGKILAANGDYDEARNQLLQAERLATDASMKASIDQARAGLDGGS